MSPSPTKLIEIRDMVAKYGDQIILEDVTLDVYKNEILAIVGGSGCGKTTLLRHMVGLRPPDAGTNYH
jgi:phospholipid/cholesterol/gamma-HCH transport system ATP-binding protein